MRIEFEFTDEQLDELAGLVAARIRADATPAPAELVDAATLAHTLGVSRDTVYAHADELGGRRVGDGDRPRLRFNLDEALAAWQPLSAPMRSAPRRRSSNGRSNLLPVIE
jgi:hypothetical protein